jgi:hypothetical protein
VGAKITIRTGPYAGTVLTVTGNTTANQSNTGVSYTFTPALPGVPAAGTVFTVENSPTAPSSATLLNSGDTWLRNNGGVFSTNTTDLPPNTTGIQALTMDASAVNSWPTANFWFDSADTKVFYLMTGPYTATVWAKAMGGSPVMTLSCARAFNFSQTYTLTNEWAEYTFHFTPNETAATTPRTIQFSITITGGIASIDDASLTSDGDTNPTVFTQAYLNTIKQGNFDTQRFWEAQHAETLDNWLKPALGRANAIMGSGDSGYTSVMGEPLGLHEFLFMCQYLGHSRVTFVMPITFTATEGANLVEYLAGASTTTYGAKRAALGQTAPWTTVFKEINIEYGNEVWNYATPACMIPYGNAGTSGSVWGYFDMITPMGTAMRGSASWSPVLKLVCTVQMSSWWVQQLTAEQLALIDKFDFAPYTQGSGMTAVSPTSALFTPVFAECYANSHDPNCASGFYSAVKEAIALGKTPLVYEFQNSTDSGPATTAEMTGFAEGIAYGVANVMQALEGMKLGVPEWNIFCMPGFDVPFTNSAGQSTTKLSRLPGSKLGNPADDGCSFLDQPNLQLYSFKRRECVKRCPICVRLRVHVSHRARRDSDQHAPDTGL